MPGELPRLRADAVVVGSGAGGAPAAARLAEAGFEVVVLEAGPRFSSADFLPDEALMTARLGRATATASGAHNLYAGACVGGSTVVNDALCWRTPPEVLEQWRREHALGDLSDAAFAPFIDAAWMDVHAEPTLRSHMNRNAHRLELGSRRLGWAGEAMPRNVKGCARLGRCNWGCPIAAKQSTLVSYLPRAERAGARVLPDTQVTRVRVEAGAVAGVEALRLDPATREPLAALRVDAPLVLLAAGVLATPALLLRSGLGAQGAAGRGLQLHSSAAVTARFAEPVHGYFGPTMAFAVTQFSDVNGHAGPGFMLENTAVHPLITATALPGFGPEHARAMQALPQLARAVVVLRDTTRGRIEIDDEGRARCAYALTAGDLERMRQALRELARAYLAADAREVWLPVHGLASVERESDLAQLDDAPLDPTRLAFLYAVHLFGGATMGGQRGVSACRPDGELWDVRGLYVTDASALPSNTGVNPQVTIFANALRIASALAERGPRA
jgi:choline dehydrogenase-like flavoprotein